jgi:DNA-binding CsgD family transcriptional regulator
MHHIVLFFYMSVLLVSAAALAVGSFVYSRVRDPLLRRYLVLVSSFTMFVLGFALPPSYVNLNLPELPFAIQAGLVGFGAIAAFFLMFAVPYFSHGLVWISPPRWLDAAVGLLAVVGLLFVFLSLRIDSTELVIAQERGFAMYAAITLFFLTVSYSILLKIIALRRSDRRIRPFIRWNLPLTLCFFPGFLLDLALVARRGVLVFTPLFFGVFCILSTRYIARNYRVMRATVAEGFDTDALGPILISAEISAREREVITLIAKGNTTRQIAESLFISPHTVKTHIRNIFRKLGVRSRFELVLLLRDAGDDGRSP